MTTKNLIPRASGEGGIGIHDVTWGEAYYDTGNFNKGLFVSGQNITQVIAETVTQGGLGGEWAKAVNGADIYYNGGNVGIGTTNPGETLTVAKESNPRLLISNSGSTSGTSSILFGDSSSDESGRIIYAHTNNSLSFYTDQAERLTIDSVGNVGIGTTDPGGSLHVNTVSRALTGTVIVSAGSTNVAGTGTLFNTELTQGDRIKIGSEILTVGTITNDTDLTLTAAHTAGANSATVAYTDNNGLIVTSAGNVGIGTTSPGTTLDINASSPILTLSLGGQAKSRFGIASSTSSILDGSLTDDLCIRTEGSNIKFGTAAATKTDMCILSSGNVGIGTTSPDRNLEVKGEATFINNDSEVLISNTADHCRIYSRINSTNLEKDLGIYTGTTEKMRITSTGNVGIGTTSPSRKLDVDGTIGGDTYGFRPDSQSKWYHFDNFTGGNFLGRGGAGYTSLYDASKLSMVWKAGNVGIGTTNPGGSLHVNTVSRALTGTVSVAAGTTGVTGSATAFTNELSVGDRIKIASQILTVDSITDDTNLTLSAAHTAGANVVNAYTDNNGLIVTSAGNVGIGTTSPTNALNVIKSSTTGVPVAWIHNSNNTTTGDFGTVVSCVNDNPNVNVFQVRSNNSTHANGNALFTVKGEGNVGIGTSSPISPLHVSSSSAQTISLTTKTDISGIVGGAASKIEGGALVGTGPSMGAAIGLCLLDSDASGPGTNTEGYLYFETKTSGAGLTEKMRITSAGNVGIGTSNPIGKLSIEGDNATNYKTHIVFSNLGGTKDFAIGAGIHGLTDNGFGIINRDTNDALLYVSDSGNVGIGTPSPVEILHLKEAAPELWLESSDAGGETYAIKSTSTGNFWVGMPASTHTLAAGDVKLAINSAGNVGIGTVSPVSPLHIFGQTNNLGGLILAAAGTNIDSLRFWIDDSSTAHINRGGSEVISITKQLNVGIGHSNPGGKLHVSDVSRELTGTVTVSPTSTDVTGTGTLFDTELSAGDRIKIGSEILTVGSITNDTSLTLTAVHTAGETSTTAYTDTNGLFVTSAGNVGIGVLDPTVALHVNGSARIERLGGSPLLQFTDQGSSNRWIGIVDGTDRFSVYATDSTTEQLSIDADGNVGIGTVSPDSRLTVNTDNAVSGYPLKVQAGGGGVGDKGIYISAGQGTPSAVGDCVYIDFHDGDGTAAGGIRCSSITSTPEFYGGSDIRMKKNIEDCEINGIEKIKSLKLRKWDWNTERDMPSTDLGLIADEIEEVYPELISRQKLNGWEHCVSEGEEDLKTIPTESKITLTLVKAIQEQQQLIEDLRSEVEALKNK